MKKKKGRQNFTNSLFKNCNKYDCKKSPIIILKKILFFLFFVCVNQKQDYITLFPRRVLISSQGRIEGVTFFDLLATLFLMHLKIPGSDIVITIILFLITVLG